MNIPNLLTTMRFILIPVFYFVYSSSINGNFEIAIIIFLVSGITDILDGYIARKYNMITKWGTLLDPLADKLMTITVLYCLSSNNILPNWIFFLILAKEVIMVAGGVRLLKYKEYIPAKYYGKITTFLIYIAIGIMIFNKNIGIYILYAAMVMAIFAFLNYLKAFIDIAKKQKNKINSRV